MNYLRIFLLFDIFDNMGINNSCYAKVALAPDKLSTPPHVTSVKAVVPINIIYNTPSFIERRKNAMTFAVCLCDELQRKYGYNIRLSKQLLNNIDGIYALYYVKIYCHPEIINIISNYINNYYDRYCNIDDIDHWFIIEIKKDISLNIIK